MCQRSPCTPLIVPPTQPSYGDSIARWPTSKRTCVRSFFLLPAPYRRFTRALSLNECSPATEVHDACLPFLGTQRRSAASRVDPSGHQFEAWCQFQLRPNRHNTDIDQLGFRKWLAPLSQQKSFRLRNSPPSRSEIPSPVLTTVVPLPVASGASHFGNPARRPIQTNAPSLSP